MTQEKARGKETLLDYTATLAREIKSCQETVEELQANLLTIKGIRYDLEKLQGGKQEADGGLTDKIAKLTDSKEGLARRLELLIDCQAHISLAIEELEDPIHRAILRYRYIMCYSWPKTAEKLGYSLRHSKRLGKEAVELLELPEEWHAMSLNDTSEV